jgi:glycerophosphoryl diester phosphodiesterase
MGVDMIELDVQLSLDGELIVIHDFELERTTNGRGAVRQHSLDSLRKLDAGSWFSPEFQDQRILTLSEVFELVGERADLNVEVKPTAGDEQLLATTLLELLRRFDKTDSTIISCFDFGVLHKVRALDASVPIGLLTHDADFSNTLAVARELSARSLHPYWALVTPDFISDAREAALEVIVWTVNDVATMDELIRRGVDGIISDHPERFGLVKPRFG